MAPGWAAVAFWRTRLLPALDAGRGGVPTEFVRDFPEGCGVPFYRPSDNQSSTAQAHPREPGARDPPRLTPREPEPTAMTTNNQHVRTGAACHLGGRLLACLAPLALSDAPAPAQTAGAQPRVVTASFTSGGQKISAEKVSRTVLTPEHIGAWNPGPARGRVPDCNGMVERATTRDHLRCRCHRIRRAGVPLLPLAPASASGVSYQVAWIAYHGPASGKRLTGQWMSRAAGAVGTRPPL
jgi:hypothetical protein